ncbi:hypothetical protein PVL29_020945 [Vitis rotundifolia]|uniref:Uncharacterized protein n=1 Tax=Vitis rotundifolia TaxID=103349 RepID=A0AA38YYL4_VITRO|nr:hypothetical protein PVL29_020945 [Vitis rotundifolia]
MATLLVTFSPGNAAAAHGLHGAVATAMPCPLLVSVPRMDPSSQWYFGTVIDIGRVNIVSNYGMPDSADAYPHGVQKIFEVNIKELPEQILIPLCACHRNGKWPAPPSPWVAFERFKRP